MAEPVLTRTVGSIDIRRTGDGLETQWELIGPSGTFAFIAGEDGTLPLTTAGFDQAGVPAGERDAIIDGVWKFTPAAVRRLSVDGNVVRKHGA